MTSSDLGSIGDNDVDLSISNDVKGKHGPEDVISIDGSASLTLDSLEEEDSLKKEQCLGESPAALSVSMQSKTSSLSDSTDSFYQHDDQENTTKIESCKDKCKLSDLAVHSEKKMTKGGKHRGSRPESENDTNSETDKTCNQTERKTIKHDKSKEANSPLSNRESYDVGTSLAEHEEDAENCEQQSKASESPASLQHREPRCVSPAEPVGRLRLQKSQSLTDESSTDVSPTTISKRSGIPRRKISDQSTITVISSSRSTSQNSPASLCRSLTLSSAPLNHYPAPTSADSSPGSDAPASFPQTPVRVPKLRRSSSHSETFAMSSASFGLSAPLCR